MTADLEKKEIAPDYSKPNAFENSDGTILVVNDTTKPVTEDTFYATYYKHPDKALLGRGQEQFKSNYTLITYAAVLTLQND